MVFIGTNGTTSGWIERYDPSFAKWVGSSMHFAFVFHGARLKRGERRHETVLRTLVNAKLVNRTTITMVYDIYNIYNYNLVGSLEHDWIIFPCIGNNYPKWLSYFTEGLKPPTSHRDEAIKGPVMTCLI